jgi:hypothetical protein
MQPKLAVITVTGCHLIPVIGARRELADLGNLSAALER